VPYCGGVEESWIFTKRALYIHKRDLYIRKKSSIYPQKSPTYVLVVVGRIVEESQNPINLQKEIYISARKPYIFAQKRPIHLQKSPAFVPVDCEWRIGTNIGILNVIVCIEIKKSPGVLMYEIFVYEFGRMNSFKEF